MFVTKLAYSNEAYGGDNYMHYCLSPPFIDSRSHFLPRGYSESHVMLSIKNILLG